MVKKKAYMEIPASSEQINAKTVSHITSVERKSNTKSIAGRRRANIARHVLWDKSNDESEKNHRYERKSSTYSESSKGYSAIAKRDTRDDENKTKNCIWYSRWRICIWLTSVTAWLFDSGYPCERIEGSFTVFLLKIVQHSGFSELCGVSLTRRHTNITLLLAAGIPLRTVSYRAGHAQTSTTSNIYSHAIRTADDKAADVLEGVLM